MPKLKEKTIKPQKETDEFGEVAEHMEHEEKLAEDSPIGADEMAPESDDMELDDEELDPFNDKWEQ